VCPWILARAVARLPLAIASRMNAPEPTHQAAHNRHYVRRPAKPWQRLYLRPDPQGHRSLRPILA
jgi:hypothetical protein